MCEKQKTTVTAKHALDTLFLSCTELF